MADGKPPPKASKRKRAKAPTKAKATSATKRKAGTKATAKAKASAARPAGGASRAKGARGRATALPRDLAKSIEDGQRATVDAVRKFVDTVDRALPMRGNTAPKRQEIVDSALELAERLVQAQYDFLRKAVRSAGRSFGDSVKRH